MRRYVIQTTDTIEKENKIYIVVAKDIKEALINIGIIPKLYDTTDNVSVCVDNGVELDKIYSEEIQEDKQMKNKQGITGIELLKYLVVVFILTTLGSFAFVGCGEMATSGRYVVKTPYFECAGVLYYDPVRFKCDDGTMYYYITNYTLKEINK